MKSVHAIIAVGLLLMSQPAQSAGAFMSGNEMHDQCQKQSLIVLGFVMGVSDTHEAYSDFGNTPVAFCVPTTATGRQVVDVFCGYLRDTPQNRNQSAASLAVVAFSKAWPCS